MFTTFIFIASIFLPVYTYALYPLILKLLPGRPQRESSGSDNKLKVKIFIISDELQKSDEKKKMLLNLYSEDKLSIKVVKSYKTVSDEVNAFTENSKDEILVFTDSETVFGKDSLEKLVQPFTDPDVGFVVGMMRNMPKPNGVFTDSAFWKYENKVRFNESKIGAVSGANNGIYAVRKNLFPVINERIINPDFYIATEVAVKGYDSIFAPDAIAYEPVIQDKVNTFKKHVNDSCGNFQCLGLMFRLNVKHLFVFVSHRMLKWFVPLNIVLLFISNIFLAWDNVFFKVLLAVQLWGHITVIGYHILTKKKNLKVHGIVGRIIALADYFYTLNIAIGLGFIRFIKGCSKY